MLHTKNKPLPASSSQQTPPSLPLSGEEKGSLPLIRGIKGVCTTKSRHGFTLVELIVVITIIAILGAIAFTAFNGFQSSARDSTRASDLANLSQGLDTSYVKIGSYPNPDNSFTVTYSGGYLWYQGTVGDTLINILSSNGAKLSKKPTDPLTPTKEYTYSKSAYGNTYELTSNWEGDRIAYITPASFLSTPLVRGNQLELLLVKGLREAVGLRTVYAANNNPTIIYTKGNYNGMVAKTTTGSTIYVIATPSITTSTGTAGSNIDVTTLSGKLLYSGQTNSGGIAYTPKLIYSSGALPTNDTTGQITLLTTNLQTAYSGSVVSQNANISNILNTTGATNITSLGANIITNYLGGSASAPPPPPATSYSLSNSLLFDSASSQYLSRTPSVVGNRKKWTWSGWFKRTSFGSAANYSRLFSAGTPGVSYTQLGFTSDDRLSIGQNDSGVSTMWKYSSAQYRDPSAWYHIIAIFDTTNTTTEDMVRLYVNGQRITSWSANTLFAQNTDGYINTTVANYIGRYDTNYLDGYLADVNFVDSGALDPTAFGYADPTTNQWLPKQYTGTYGTNGFHLDFSSGALTSGSNVGLGKDSSGNGNYWNTNGITDPTANQVIDTPLNNFATLNPLNRQLTGANSKGNLRVATTVNTNVFRVATFPIEHNAYFEISATANARFGLIWGQTIDDGTNWLNSSSSYFLLNSGGALTSVNSTVSQSLVPSWANGDIISFIWNATDKTLTVLRNNSQISVITVTNPSTIPPSLLVANITSSLTTDISVNFGQGGQAGLTYSTGAAGYFKFSPPTGFKALSTANLPPPAIVNPKQYFDVLTYTGNSSTQTIAGLGFQPDFVWIKGRTTGYDHVLFDTIRGPLIWLNSNLTLGESTIVNSLTSFDAAGFNLGGGSSAINNTLNNYVAWNWKKGNGTTGPGFDIQTVSHTSGVLSTHPHSLGTTPSFIIVKPRNENLGWNIYHKNLNTSPKDYTLNFTTGSVSNFSNLWGTSGVGPDASNFYLGTLFSGTSYIAYLWSEVPGFSKFGSYTGNGSSDGPFVYTGFRPKYVMWKATSTTGGGSDWIIWDSARSTYNVSSNDIAPSYNLYANSSTIENIDPLIDATANGFKISGTALFMNAPGVAYIYAAFAEAPFKYANAR